MTAIRLSREAVQAKYSPIPDPLWTPEVEAQFFAGLPKTTYRETVKAADEKEMLIREFGKKTLNAHRMSAGYISTLRVILGEFADADDTKTECLISRRAVQRGTPDTIRTIQAQMLTAGYLVKTIRPQGKGFVGDVFVYAPQARYRHRTATQEILERAYRDSEGDCVCPCSPLPANLSPGDVPF